MASELYDAYVKRLEDSNAENEKATDISTAAQLDAIKKNKDTVEAKRQSEYKGAYTDYRKEANPYGYNAEVLASRGIDKSGKSETAAANFYNSYQNRLGSIDSGTREQLSALDTQAAGLNAEAEASKAAARAQLGQNAAAALWTDADNDLAREQWNYQKQLQDAQEARAAEQWELQKRLSEAEEDRAAKQWELTYGGRLAGGSGNNDSAFLRAADIRASYENNNPYVTYSASSNPVGDWYSYYANLIASTYEPGSEDYVAMMEDLDATLANYQSKLGYKVYKVGV